MSTYAIETGQGIELDFVPLKVGDFVPIREHNRPDGMVTQVFDRESGKVEPTEQLHTEGVVIEVTPSGRTGFAKCRQCNYRQIVVARDVEAQVTSLTQ